MKTADEILNNLMAGNKRFVTGKLIHPNHTAERRKELAQGQRPTAIIVGCSDSRVPPEIIFDHGLGDLFMIRTAGHVVDEAAMGSIEYAAEHLSVPLLIVLGHQRCGAVEATIKGGELPGCLPCLVKALRPAVEKAQGQNGDLLTNAVKTHVKMSVERLKNSKPILHELAKEGKLKIVGAYYNWDTGSVELIN